MERQVEELLEEIQELVDERDYEGALAKVSALQATIETLQETGK